MKTGSRLKEIIPKESMPSNHKNNVKTGLRLKEKLLKKIMPRNNKNNLKTGLQLKEIMPKESVPRNHKNNVKTGLRFKETIAKESMPRNHKSNVKIITWHPGTAQSYDYSLSRCVQIGTMSKICPYCKALKFKGKTMGMCCASGKLKLSKLELQ